MRRVRKCILTYHKKCLCISSIHRDLIYFRTQRQIDHRLFDVTRKKNCSNDNRKMCSHFFSHSLLNYIPQKIHTKIHRTPNGIQEKTIIYLFIFFEFDRGEQNVFSIRSTDESLNITKFKTCDRGIRLRESFIHYNNKRSRQDCLFVSFRMDLCSG